LILWGEVPQRPFDPRSSAPDAGCQGLLPPVFAKVENWDEHLVKLRAFWSSVVLMSGRYHGLPMQAHFPLSIETQHFNCWLALFERATADVCPPAAAGLFMEKARRIADSFEMAMATGVARSQGRGIRDLPEHSGPGFLAQLREPWSALGRHMSVRGFEGLTSRPTPPSDHTPLRRRCAVWGVSWTRR
jgi:truncated hemoglobin YjbI